MSRLHLTKIEKLQVKVIQDVFTPWGLGTAVDMGGKHLRIRVFARDGTVHRLTVACTPRCGEHSLTMARKHALRLLRLLNAGAGY